MSAKLSQTQLKAHLEQFMSLVRQGGWKADIIEAEKITEPKEDIILFTVRFGKRKK